MAQRKISPTDLALLRPLEKELKLACQRHDAAAAEMAMKKIQKLLTSYGDTHARLLEARLWYFEGVLDAGQVSVAESGFIGIRAKANSGTRLHLEATFLLGVCLLRQKKPVKVIEAKEHFRFVLREINKISSANSRRLLQRRIVERLEEEAILTHLIGTDEDTLAPEKIHEGAIVLIKTKSDDEIYEVLAGALPAKSVHLLIDIRGDAILQLPSTDRLRLPAPAQATSSLNIGRRAGAMLKKIAWRTVCKVDSPIYKLWSQKTPQVYSASFFAAAIVQTFNDFKIGVPALATGLVALLMKSSAHEFCDWAKPEPIMGSRRKGEKS